MDISSETQTPPEVHIDTVILRALIDEKDDSRTRLPAIHFFNRESRRIGISLFATGEAFQGISNERDTASLSESAANLSLLMRRGRVVTIGSGDNSREVVPIALELMHRQRLDCTDALILSTAVTDKHCKEFYTTDSKLVLGNYLKEVARMSGKRFISIPVRD